MARSGPEQDLGWIVSGNPDAGQWERGVPAGGDLGPDEDSDGSGQCYVTGLAQGEDVDGSTAVLTSPLLDASDPAVVLSFDVWYDNDGDEDVDFDDLLIVLSAWGPCY